MRIITLLSGSGFTKFLGSFGCKGSGMRVSGFRVSTVFTVWAMWLKVFSVSRVHRVCSKVFWGSQGFKGIEDVKGLGLKVCWGSRDICHTRVATWSLSIGP